MDQSYKTMNKWVKKSINLASSYGYLDKLSRVYPINLEIDREISAEEQERIEKAFHKKDVKILISVLLDLERFPIDDPYIGFFRKDRSALKKNPKTVDRIGQRLLSMGLKKLLAGANRPKSSSRQFGQTFSQWLPKLGYPILSPQKFLEHKGIAILKGKDVALKDFAHRELGYNGEKGLDLVLRINNKFIIGEAKFISRSGGTQDKSFRETINLIKHKDKKATRIAILDGVVWLASKKLPVEKKKKQSLYESVSHLNVNQLALSVLLLKDFVRASARTV